MSKASLDRVILAGLVVMSVLLYLSTDSYPGIAQKTSANYVRFLAVSMGGLALVQLVISLRTANRTEKVVLTEHVPRFLGLIAALVLFAVAFKTLGFFIPAAVFIPVVALILGQRNPVLIAAVTAGVLLSVYLIFVTLLGVVLPGPGL